MSSPTYRKWINWKR